MASLVCSVSSDCDFAAEACASTLAVSPCASVRSLPSVAACDAVRAADVSWKLEASEPTIAVTAAMSSRVAPRPTPPPLAAGTASSSAFAIAFSPA